MLWYVILVAGCCLLQVQAIEGSPRIIIIGAGASGIAAASRLMENGFYNITILEAENRTGGRIQTNEFGGYTVDLGGQSVHGEEDNIVYELAWPLGLLEHSRAPTPKTRFFSSSGHRISDNTGINLMELYVNITNLKIPDEYLNKSIGEFYQQKFDDYFDSHPEITEEQRKSLTNMFNSFDMALHAADSWYDVSVNPEEKKNKGDFMINWKDKGFNMIFDILTKKYPDPGQELPVMNNTILNAEVSQINYNDGPVRVVTANGDEYRADHVIVTIPIGVLKADHKTLFDPSLPEIKTNAFKGIESGSTTKIILFYDDPWWIESDETTDKLFNFYWTEQDRKELANDPEKSWLLGLVMALNVEHKRNLLLCWVTGPGARKVEILPEDIVLSHIKEFFHRFLGNTYNLTEPKAIQRSQFYTNKHFRGTLSYLTPEFLRSGSRIADLGDPIVKDGKPIVLFAGEGTHAIHPSTVHGAIVTGFREADRLINFYSYERQISQE